MSSRRTILVVGDVSRPEFRPAVESLSRAGAVVFQETLRDAVQWLASGEQPPELIVLVQCRPHEFPTEAVEELRRQAPLARILALLGSWCEGELRSGRPWPGAIRRYWHQWSAALEHEVLRADASLSPVWSLAATATDEERLLAWEYVGSEAAHGFILVVAARADIGETLVATCQAHGHASAWLRPGSEVIVAGPTAVIWDVPPVNEVRDAQLRHLRKNHPHAPILSLSDFPRPEDRQWLLDSGVAALLSKPWLASDVIAEVSRLMAR
jgi:hypothetical protein